MAVGVATAIDMKRALPHTSSVSLEPRVNVQRVEQCDELRSCRPHPLGMCPYATNYYVIDEAVIAEFKNLERTFFKPIWLADLTQIVDDLLSRSHATH